MAEWATLHIVNTNGLGLRDRIVFPDMDTNVSLKQGVQVSFNSH